MTTLKEQIKSLHDSGYTCKQIAETIKKHKNTVRFHLKSLGLNINKETRWFSQTKQNLSLLQEQMILGSLLGDMSLKKSGKNARLCLVHSYKQKELFLQKVKILDVFMGSWRQKDSYDKRTQKIYSQYRGNSKTHNVFTQIYNILYINKCKTISQKYLDLINHPIALAYWFMDDGTNRGTFATNCFSEQEVNLLVTWLKEKWGIIATKQKNLTQFVIHISAKSRKLFENLIKPYVIPSMEYKLLYNNCEVC